MLRDLVTNCVVAALYAENLPRRLCRSSPTDAGGVPDQVSDAARRLPTG